MGTENSMQSSDIVEALGCDPATQEIVFSRQKTEVTLTLPHDNFIIGELLHPYSASTDIGIGFHIIDFQVNEAMRRNGIGKKLLKAITRYAVDNDANFLYGSVENSNALRTRASVFGVDNMSFYSLYSYYGSKHLFRSTYDEVIENDLFPMFVVSDLTQIDPSDLR